MSARHSAPRCVFSPRFNSGKRVHTGDEQRAAM